MVLAALQDWAPLIKVIVILLVAIVLTILARRLLTKRATALLARFGTVSTDPAREAARVRTLSAVTQSATLGAIWLIAMLAILQVVNNAISSFVLAITLLGERAHLRRPEPDPRRAVGLLHPLGGPVRRR